MSLPCWWLKYGWVIDLYIFPQNVFLSICCSHWQRKDSGLNWSEHVQKGRCGVKKDDGDRVHPAQQGSCWRWYFSTNAKSIREQCWAVAWLKMDENPLVPEKAACFHTLTPPAPCTYIQRQSFQHRETFVPTVKLIPIFFVSTKADGSICIQV